MSHTYADVNRFRLYLIDGGQDDWTQSDVTVRTLLEGASRRIDEWCDRSDFGSGFGPRTGTNTYENPHRNTLDLRDDLLTITTLTTHDANGDSGVVLTSGTDFYTPDLAPWRSLTLNLDGSGDWGAAQRGNIIIGTWGYSNDVAPLATGGTVNASATSIVLTAGSAYAGQTIRIDSEQMYVTASGGTATIVRAVNGTTAAVHAASSQVYAYTYPSDVVTACLQLTARRYRMAQSGVTGDYGGGNLPFHGNRDTETSVLRSIGHLRRYGTA